MPHLRSNDAVLELPVAVLPSGAWRLVGLAVVAACASSGCFRDLDLAICRKDPTNAVCFADASDASSSETSSSMDANEDTGADTSIGADSAVDGTTTDTANASVDSEADADDAWTAIPATTKLPPRSDCFALWTGKAAIIWGGIGPPSPGAVVSDLHSGAIFVP